MNRQELDALEALIDAHTLADVVGALAQLASEKADHIRENWQDDTTAEVWDNHATHLLFAEYRVANNIPPTS